MLLFTHYEFSHVSIDLTTTQIQILKHLYVAICSYVCTLHLYFIVRMYSVQQFVGSSATFPDLRRTYSTQTVNTLPLYTQIVSIECYALV